jgi:hypothetical protein
MANPTIALIDALRLTATNLRNGAYHSWGHHGACNCGNLVQSVTKFTKEEILRHAHTGTGEWTELAIDFCPITIGLTPSDIHHIEYLSDREVLNNLPGGFRWLKRNKKEDAIAYFETFATVLEEKLLQGININLGDILQNSKSNSYANVKVLA